jgi:hypothetical protein
VMLSTLDAQLSAAADKKGVAWDEVTVA